MKEQVGTCNIDYPTFAAFKNQGQVICKRPFGDTDCFVFENVLSKEQCEYLVSCTERTGYTYWDSREEKRTDFRNAYTIEVTEKDIAAYIWAKMKPFMNFDVEVNESSGERWQRDLEGFWEPYNTNENILFARYNPGGHFAPHTDGYNVLDCDRRSMYSIVLYLNDCHEGGGTRFYHDDQKAHLVLDSNGRFTGKEEHVLGIVDPIMGSCCVFFHNILHEGVAVGINSSKYIIRSDIMYIRKDPILKSAVDRAAFEMYQQAEELSNQGLPEEAMPLYRKAVKMSQKLADLYGM